MKPGDDEMQGWSPTHGIPDGDDVDAVAIQRWVVAGVLLTILGAAALAMWGCG